MFVSAKTWNFLRIETDEYIQFCSLLQNDKIFRKWLTNKVLKAILQEVESKGEKKKRERKFES